MSTYWLAYTVVTVLNVALWVYNQRTAHWCKRVMREVPQRLAIAWNTGYQRGMSDEINDVTHGADNPYIDGPAMREWRESGGAA